MVGGSDGESGGMPEIFNLGCPTFQCNKIDEVPGGGAIANIINSVGAIIGDTPIICGGNHPEQAANIYDKCFKFIKKDGGYHWVPFDNTLSIARFFRGDGSIVIEDQLLVSGGIIGHGGPYSVLQELVSLDGEFTSSELKSPANYGHCMVQINETSVVAIGGIGKAHDQKTTFMNFKTGKISSGPELANKRHANGCGKITIGGDTVVFSVGGGTPWQADFQHTTEYLKLDKDDAEWKAGPDLPIGMREMRVIPSRNGKTLFLVGGRKGPEFNDYIEEIHQLVCEGNKVRSCQWVDTGVKIEQPRRGHQVFPIPESMANELCN